MQIQDVQRNNKRTRSRQVGRGGKRGKTSGRGTKGQKARAGRKLRPEIRDLIKKLPKLRGRGIHPNKKVAPTPLPVNLSTLEKFFLAGEVVSPKTLLEKKIISRVAGKMPVVKILAKGEITKKLTITNCLISASALAKLQASGADLA